MEHKFSVVDGWLKPARLVCSPNYNQRPEGTPVSLLVVHNISLPPNEFGGGYVELFFQNKLPRDVHPFFEEIAQMQVSAHLFVDRQGEVVQFVNLDHRAWHAGRSEFDGVPECNDYSIGIELEGADHIPYTDVQYEVLAGLTAAIQSAYPQISGERITGHEHIAPKRKSDPGPAFDWIRYRKAVCDQ